MAGCRPLSGDELTRLVGTCRGFWGARDRAFIILGAATGFRCSELLSLLRRDVLDSGGRVRRELTVKRRNMKKKMEARSIPLTEFARIMLRDWLLTQEAAGYVLRIDPLFPKQGAVLMAKAGRVVGVEPWKRRAAWAMMRRRCRAAGITEAKTGTHSLRKSFAGAVYSDLLDRLARGEKVDPLRRVQSALGHRKIESTMQYLRSVTPEERAQSFEAASLALGLCFNAPG